MDLEMINLDTMTSCVINNTLDQIRAWHTGNGNIVCAGHGTDANGNRNRLSSCYNIATRTSVNLLNERNGHTSWSTDDGIYLLGGYPGKNYRTTELITGDTTQAGFTLKHAHR